ncbi:MAG: hypothetical protein ABI806_04605 [Candidatus Solibacter sp.]
MTPQIDATFTPAEERRRPAPFVIAAIAVSVLFLGWVLLSRGPAVAQSAASAAAPAQKTDSALAFYGNGQLKVLSFYASPVEVRRGSRALVCYGVSNASAVRIEPALGETWPSTSRCMEVTGTKDTEYKLTAQDSAGHEETRTLSLKVTR